ncbi:hypothetical protein M2404_002956 [Rheinheimera pacifica]|uniref:hypothetical protein n=1 Tax=Rheinheimera pacifica TaxID=173990 RepID=UPI00216A5A21|nr:hypothetical protein [Rheinheimera pacifica]MCS4308599.1 hypothetical protein [Rheinheimera pacifica]
MDFFINDIVWWKMSLNGLMNGWIPGVLTFFLGLWFSKISDHRKLRQKLKNDILEIFIPVFNSGESISIPIADEACRKMRATFNTYKGIYPGMFDREAEKQLGELLNEGFIVNGEINKRFFEPDTIQDLIKHL